MTKHLNHFTYTLLLALAVSFQPTALLAEGAVEKASPLFKFQQKLALKGNMRAQYKLACMYETGKGVTLNIEQAKHWFEKAHKDGMKSAGDRYTYLAVKEQGFDQAAHTAWLDGVKADVDARNGDAMFLLGQLYREGLGVKKDLNKSLSLFEQVSLSGDADIQEEIDMIQAEIAKNEKAWLAARKQREAARMQAEKAQQASIEQPAAATATTPVLPVAAATKEQQMKQQADAESLKQVEKIRRYERAMMQLKLEQRQIEEQQAWATGGDSAMADDEI